MALCGRTTWGDVCLVGLSSMSPGSRAGPVPFSERQYRGRRRFALAFGVHVRREKKRVLHLKVWITSATDSRWRARRTTAATPK